MGKCKYCGKDAGFFRSVHEACEKAHEQSLQQLSQSLNDYFSQGSDLQSVQAAIQSGKSNAYLADDDIVDAIQTAIEKYIPTIQYPISKTVMQKIDAFLHNISLPYSRLNAKGILDRLSSHIYKGVLVDFFADNVPMPKIQSKINAEQRLLPLPQAQQEDIQQQVFALASTNYLADGLLSDKEQATLEEYSTTFAIPLNTTSALALPANSPVEKANQAIILKNMQKGVMPNFSSYPLPILLGAKEKLIWQHQNISMYNEKIEREFVGRRSGFSVRVMKGVYYHIGGSKGHPVEHSSMVKEGLGTLFLTNKNIIFYSTTKSVRIPYSKIVAVVPYSDGIEIQKDGNAKRQIFQGFDSWFLMNLLSIVNDI